jgi:hypothetical protein
MSSSVWGALAIASEVVNFGKGTEDLIKALMSWDREYGIDIYAALTDTVRGAKLNR